MKAVHFLHSRISRRPKKLSSSLSRKDAKDPWLKNRFLNSTFLPEIIAFSIKMSPFDTFKSL